MEIYESLPLHFILLFKELLSRKGQNGQENIFCILELRIHLLQNTLVYGSFLTTKLYCYLLLSLSQQKTVPKWSSCLDCWILSFPYCLGSICPIPEFLPKTNKFYTLWVCPWLCQMKEENTLLQCWQVRMNQTCLPPGMEHDDSIDEDMMGGGGKCCKSLFALWIDVNGFRAWGSRMLHLKLIWRYLDHEYIDWKTRTSSNEFSIGIHSIPYLFLGT